MHVGTKKLALSGLLLALAVLAIVLSGVLEWNTLFLLGAASFLIGIQIRECGLYLGAAFYLGAVILGLILAPNKIYCLTFLAMGGYVVAVEFLWKLLGKLNPRRNRKAIFMVGKFLVFNLIYLPILFLFPQLLFAKAMNTKLLVISLIAGQAVFWIYDKAYEYFLQVVWFGLRKRLKLEDFNA